MSASRRRIDQIKAKLDQLDKSIASTSKQNAVNLVDLVGGADAKPMTKRGLRQSQQVLDKNRLQNSDGDVNRFYEEAKANMMVKQRLDEEVTKGYKKIANKKKLTDNSAQILAERLNTNVAIAILNADQELTKQLTFEQVGKILSDLRVFSVVAFNENFEGGLSSGKGGINRR